MIPIIVECAEPEGPYGAKGLGEPGLAPTPAAIGNAVADAIGVRVYDLPLKPENVFWAIQKNKKKTPPNRPTSNFDNFSSNIWPTVEPQVLDR